ncbi:MULTISPECIES: choice-of-anchor I family protein [unclassified Microbacterium]|uniref:choice-of-anchor I family protein n=1 Tax=Microbacterium TaxID=33882 RepID=UPI003BA355DD
MPSSPFRRAVGAAAVAATACALAIAPVTAASAALVPDPLVHASADAPFDLVPTGTFETGVFDEGASEIVQAHGDRLFSINAAEGSVSVLDMSDPAAPTLLYTIGAEGFVANSVAIREDGLGVVALEVADDKTADGALLFFDADAESATVLGTVTVGALPDMVTVSPDGAYALVANEGEPADDFSSDPEGSIGIVTLPEAGTLAAPAQADVRIADFHAFEGGALPADVRVFGPRPHGDDLPVSRNLEPEYIAVSGTTAYAALQEANAVAVIDVPTATVTDIWSLGFKDWGQVALDPSDRDPEDAPTIDLRTFEGLHGMYMPDGIASYEVDGETYLVTANEGDAREWGDYVEPARVKDLGEVDDETGLMTGYGPVCETAFDAALLEDDQLGRLEVTTELGFDEEQGCYDELYAYGARSFSIYTADGTQVFDSGAQFEEITAGLLPEHFNAGHDDSELESRSDAKGVEPENLAVGEVDGRTYAFIGFERLGGVIAYDISDPASPAYVTYVNNRDFSVSAADDIEAAPERQAEILSQAGDLGPEGLDFIPASASPTGKPLLAVGNEVSGSTTLYTIDDGTTEGRILTINDFHGRIEANGDEAGAAVLAGAVAQFKAENPNTIFASAGDNIGASTFTSFIQDDNPTIDALVAAGLDVSAVGNHEFDQGFADLRDRVIPRYGSADLALGANVYLKGTDTPALEEYAVREVGGVRVAFIGTVTSDTATLVSPAGISELEFGSQLEAANRVAAEITADGAADVIVLLTHSGAASEDCTSVADEQSEYGELIREASPEIDAIVSGHTHQLYSCDIADRPVISAHQYGTTLGALDFQVDDATGELLSIASSTVDLVAQETDELGEEIDVPLFPADPEVQAIVDAAAAEADVLGQEVVGRISADILRGGTPPGDDRGVESTMGNLVADIYRWATSAEYANYGGRPADIAIMNPGGLRDDLLYGEDGTVTYEEAAAVQPFGNTLVTTTLTGAHLEQILEEQWQPGNERPKLHLGISDGFAYEYIEDAAAGEHIVEMTFDGDPIAPEDEFLVTTNSFIASGGDGFTTFAEGVGTADTGLIDLSATVDYFAAHEVVDPAPLGRAAEHVPGETPAPEAPEETPAPESPAPESPAPETPAPEEPAPESPAPQEPQAEQKPQGELAPTGGDMAVVGGIAAAMLIAVGALLFVVRRRRV